MTEKTTQQASTENNTHTRLTCTKKNKYNQKMQEEKTRRNKENTEGRTYLERSCYREGERGRERGRERGGERERDKERVTFAD